MDRENIDNVINRVKELLAMSGSNANSAACGYDEGWYCGEANAYETVLKILEG